MTKKLCNLKVKKNVCGIVPGKLILKIVLSYLTRLLLNIGSQLSLSVVYSKDRTRRRVSTHTGSICRGWKQKKKQAGLSRATLEFSNKLPLKAH